MAVCKQAKDIRAFTEKFNSKHVLLVMKHFENSLKRQTAVWWIERVIEIAGCI